MGVITLIEFWAKYNQVKVASTGKATQPGKKKSWTGQDPTGLQLLVVVYFMNEKLLPSVRKLRKVIDHKPVRVTGTNYSATVTMDVGFSPDKKFAKKWKEKRKIPSMSSSSWIESVVEITHNWFQFYSKKISNGRWVLSCYDGGVFPYKEALRFDGASRYEVRLACNEERISTS